jgi:hypothetical protein
MHRLHLVETCALATVCLLQYDCSAQQEQLSWYGEADAAMSNRTHSTRLSTESRMLPRVSYSLVGFCVGRCCGAGVHGGCGDQWSNGLTGTSGRHVVCCRRRACDHAAVGLHNAGKRYLVQAVGEPTAMPQQHEWGAP